MATSIAQQHSSDALVIFGITGDLAFKKIFPALQNLLRRGRSSSGGVESYAPGTWGPDAALRLAENVGGWYDPPASGEVPCA